VTGTDDLVADAPASLCACRTSTATAAATAPRQPSPSPIRTSPSPGHARLVRAARGVRLLGAGLHQTLDVEGWRRAVRRPGPSAGPWAAPAGRDGCPVGREIIPAQRRGTSTGSGAWPPPRRTRRRWRHRTGDGYRTAACSVGGPSTFRFRTARARRRLATVPW